MREEVREKEKKKEKRRKKQERVSWEIDREREREKYKKWEKKEKRQRAKRATEQDWLVTCICVARILHRKAFFHVTVTLASRYLDLNGLRKRCKYFQYFPFII